MLEGIYSSIHALVRALKVGVAMLKEQVTVLLSKQNSGRQNSSLPINASLVERLKKRQGSLKEGLTVALSQI